VGKLGGPGLHPGATKIERAAVAEGTQHLHENGVDNVLVGTTTMADLARAMV
jgi:hypothetical protein